MPPGFFSRRTVCVSAYAEGGRSSKRTKGKWNARVCFTFNPANDRLAGVREPRPAGNNSRCHLLPLKVKIYVSH